MWMPHTALKPRLARQGTGYTMVETKPTFDIRSSGITSTLKGEIARSRTTEWRNLNLFFHGKKKCGGGLGDMQ